MAADTKAWGLIAYTDDSITPNDNLFIDWDTLSCWRKELKQKQNQKYQPQIHKPFSKKVHQISEEYLLLSDLARGDDEKQIKEILSLTYDQFNRIKERTENNKEEELPYEWWNYINQQDVMFRSAIHEAAEMSNPVVIKYLLEHGADPNVCDWRGQSPLHYACRKGSIAIIKLLLQTIHYKTINLQDTSKCTALHIALTNKNEEVALLLVKYGAEYNLANLLDKTAIQVAQQLQLFSLLKISLSENIEKLDLFCNQLIRDPKIKDFIYLININSPNDESNNLLAEKEKSEKEKTFNQWREGNNKYLIDLYLTIYDELTKFNLLNLLIIQNKYKSIEFLLSCVELTTNEIERIISFSSVNSKNHFQIAIEKGNKEIVELFLSLIGPEFRKKLINQPDRDGTNPILLASKKNHWEIVKYFLIHHPNELTIRGNQFGESILYFLTNSNENQLLFDFISKYPTQIHGESVTMQITDNKTRKRSEKLVHYANGYFLAIQKNRMDILTLSAHNHVNINSTEPVIYSTKKRTPLLFAFDLKRWNLFEELISNNQIDLALSDNKRQSILHRLACFPSGNHARPSSSRSLSSKSPTAMKFYQLEMKDVIKILSSHSLGDFLVSLYAKDENGESPISLAIKLKNIEFVQSCISFILPPGDPYFSDFFHHRSTFSTTSTCTGATEARQLTHEASFITKDDFGEMLLLFLDSNFYFPNIEHSFKRSGIEEFIFQLIANNQIKITEKLLESQKIQEYFSRNTISLGKCIKYLKNDKKTISKNEKIAMKDSGGTEVIRLLVEKDFCVIGRKDLLKIARFNSRSRLFNYMLSKLKNILSSIIYERLQDRLILHYLIYWDDFDNFRKILVDFNYFKDLGQFTQGDAVEYLKLLKTSKNKKILSYVVILLHKNYNFRIQRESLDRLISVELTSIYPIHKELFIHCDLYAAVRQAISMGKMEIIKEIMSLHVFEFDYECLMDCCGSYNVELFKLMLSNSPTITKKQEIYEIISKIVSRKDVYWAYSTAPPPPRHADTFNLSMLEAVIEYYKKNEKVFICTPKTEKAIKRLNVLGAALANGSWKIISYLLDHMELLEIPLCVTKIKYSVIQRLFEYSSANSPALNHFAKEKVKLRYKTIIQSLIHHQFQFISSDFIFLAKSQFFEEIKMILLPQGGMHGSLDCLVPSIHQDITFEQDDLFECIKHFIKFGEIGLLILFLKLLFIKMEMKGIKQVDEGKNTMMNLLQISLVTSRNQITTSTLLLFFPFFNKIDFQDKRKQNVLHENLDKIQRSEHGGSETDEIQFEEVKMNEELQIKLKKSKLGKEIFSLYKEWIYTSTKQTQQSHNSPSSTALLKNDLNFLQFLSKKGEMKIIHQIFSNSPLFTGEFLPSKGTEGSEEALRAIFKYNLISHCLSNHQFNLSFYFIRKIKLSSNEELKRNYFSESTEKMRKENSILLPESFYSSYFGEFELLKEFIELNSPIDGFYNQLIHHHSLQIKKFSKSILFYASVNLLKRKTPHYNYLIHNRLPPLRLFKFNLLDILKYLIHILHSLYKDRPNIEFSQFFFGKEYGETISLFTYLLRESPSPPFIHSTDPLPEPVASTSDPYSFSLTASSSLYAAPPSSLSGSSYYDIPLDYSSSSILSSSTNDVHQANALPVKEEEEGGEEVVKERNVEEECTRVMNDKENIEKLRQEYEKSMEYVLVNYPFARVSYTIVEDLLLACNKKYWNIIQLMVKYKVLDENQLLSRIDYDPVESNEEGEETAAISKVGASHASTNQPSYILSGGLSDKKKQKGNKNTLISKVIDKIVKEEEYEGLKIILSIEEVSNHLNDIVLSDYCKKLILKNEKILKLLLNSGKYSISNLLLSPAVQMIDYQLFNNFLSEFPEYNMEYYANVSHPSLGSNILHYFSAFNKDPKIFNFLISNIFPREYHFILNDHHEFPLYFACKFGNEPIVREICENSNDTLLHKQLTLQDVFGNNVLHAACSSGSLPIVQLVASSDNVNMLNHHGDNPASIAYTFGFSHILFYLQQHFHSAITLQHESIQPTQLYGWFNRMIQLNSSSSLPSTATSHSHPLPTQYQPPSSSISNSTSYDGSYSSPYSFMDTHPSSSSSYYSFDLPPSLNSIPPSFVESQTSPLLSITEGEEQTNEKSPQDCMEFPYPANNSTRNKGKMRVKSNYYEFNEPGTDSSCSTRSDRSWDPILACKYGKLTMLQSMIESGANHYSNYIYTACKYGQTIIIEFLHSFLNEKNNSQTSEEMIDLSKLLPPPIDSTEWHPTDTENYAILIAAKNGHYECVKYLLHWHKENTENSDQSNYSTTTTGGRNGLQLRLLYDNEKNNVLHWCAYNGWKDICDELAVHPFNVSWYDKNNFNQTAKEISWFMGGEIFHEFASEKEKFTFFKKGIKYGMFEWSRRYLNEIDLSIETEKATGKSAAYLLCELKGTCDLLKEIHHIYPNYPWKKRTKNGKTIGHALCKGGDPEIFQFIKKIDKKILFEKDNFKRTPVMLAARYDQFNIFTSLIQLNFNCLFSVDEFNCHVFHYCGWDYQLGRSSCNSALKAIEFSFKSNLNAATNKRMVINELINYKYIKNLNTKPIDVQRNYLEFSNGFYKSLNEIELKAKAKILAVGKNDKIEFVVDLKGKSIPVNVLKHLLEFRSDHYRYLPCELEECTEKSSEYKVSIESKHLVMSKTIQSLTVIFCGVSVKNKEILISPFKTTKEILRYIIETNYQPIPKRIKVYLREEYIIEDTMFSTKDWRLEEWKKVITIEFKDENKSAVDRGGLLQDWFIKFSKAITNVNYGIFKYFKNSKNLITPNPFSFQCQANHLDLFLLFGRVLASAILRRKLISCDFSDFVLKKLLGLPLTLDDLREFDGKLYDSVVWIVQSDDVSTLHLTFSQELNSFDAVHMIELIPNGSNIPVTNENKETYVQSLVEFFLLEGAYAQMNHFIRGFHELIPVHLLQLISPSGLHLILNGEQQFSINQMKLYTSIPPKQKDHPIILWFWQAIEKMDKKQRSLFLKYVTNSARLPIGGFEYLHPKIHVSLVDLDWQQPRVHTCFHALDIPTSFESFEQLFNCLVQCVTYDVSGYGIV